MKQWLLALGLMFLWFGCAAEMADENADRSEQSEVEIGVKQQALNACDHKVLIPLVSYADSRFNSSGWSGSWTYLGAFGNACIFSPDPGLHYLAAMPGRSCGRVGTSGRAWLCGLTRYDCPTEAALRAPTHRMTVPYAPWTEFPYWYFSEHEATGTMPFVSSSFDAANQRIWCGYSTSGKTYHYTRNY